MQNAVARLRLGPTRQQHSLWLVKWGNETMHSKVNCVKLKQLLPATILAVSLTGCANVSGALQEAQLAVQQQAQPVVVASNNPAPQTPLPDIPKAVDDCLTRSMKTAQSRASNADGAIDIAQKVDATKQGCWRAHKKWYAELQAPRAAAEPVKAAPAKAKPAATWE